MQTAQQALVSALRREDTAVKQVQHLQTELAALQDLLTANQRELQRNQMVMKFRNAEVARRRVGQTLPHSVPWLHALRLGTKNCWQQTAYCRLKQLTCTA